MQACPGPDGLPAEEGGRAFELDLVSGDRDTVGRRTAGPLRVQRRRSGLDGLVTGPVFGNVPEFRRDSVTAFTAQEGGISDCR